MAGKLREEEEMGVKKQRNAEMNIKIGSSATRVK